MIKFYSEHQKFSNKKNFINLKDNFIWVVIIHMIKQTKKSGILHE